MDAYYPWATCGPSSPPSPEIHTQSRPQEHQPQGERPPLEVQGRFLAELDGRTDLAKVLRANYEVIVSDIGGKDEVSHVKSALVERFVWLEAILQTLEDDWRKVRLKRRKPLEGTSGQCPLDALQVRTITPAYGHSFRY